MGNMDCFCRCCMKFRKFVNERNICSSCEEHCDKNHCAFRIYPDDYEAEDKKRNQ